jgi:hypothetical protein
MIEIDGDTYEYLGQDVDRMDEAALRDALKDLMQRYETCEEKREQYRKNATKATG